MTRPANPHRATPESFRREDTRTWDPPVLRALDIPEEVVLDLRALPLSPAAAPEVSLRPLSEIPPRPPQRQEGGLLLGSLESVPVLGLIKKWGWHPVVCHEDDDLHPVRYYWEDPAGLFKPHELRERLLGWVPLPPVPSEAEA